LATMGGTIVSAASSGSGLRRFPFFSGGCTRWPGGCSALFLRAPAVGMAGCMFSAVGCAANSLGGVHRGGRRTLDHGAGFGVTQLNLFGTPLDHLGGKVAQLRPIAQGFEQAEAELFLLLLGPGEKSLARLRSALAIARRSGGRRWRGGRGLDGRLRQTRLG